MKKKSRSALFVLLTLATVSASAVAITWAAKLGEAEFGTDNTFTNNPKIALRLAEPLWDAQPYDSNANGSVIPALNAGNDHFDIGASNPASEKGQYVEDPTTTPPVSRTPSELGRNMAQDYRSGSVIPKNPSLKNTSEDDDDAVARADRFTGSKNGNVSRSEWVAIGVNYQLTVPAAIYYMNPSQSDGNANGSADHRFDVIQSSGAYIGGKTLDYDSKTAFARALADTDSASGRIAASTPSDEEETWTDISTDGKGTLYMFNQKLAKGENTNTLFDTVTIRNFTTAPDRIYARDDSGKDLILYRIDLQDATYHNEGNRENAVNGVKTAVYDTTQSERYIYVDTLPGFSINLSGYAVQGDALELVSDAVAIKTELKALADS